MIYDQADQLPLSPPKKILDRLTPVKTTNPSNSQCGSPERRSPVYKKRRTFSSQEVADRVSRIKQETESQRKRRQEKIQQKLERADQNRRDILKEKSESARRFSNDNKIWGKFKVKIEVCPTTYISPSVEDDVIEEDLPCPSSPDWMEFQEDLGILLLEELCYRQKCCSIITSRVKKHCVERKIKRITLFKESLDTALKTVSWEDLISLIQSISFRSIITITLRYFRTPGISKRLPIANVFNYAFLILADHYLEDNDDDNDISKSYDTSLGKNAIDEYSGYNLPGFMELHIYDDHFYSYILSRFLRASRRLLISFQILIRSGFKKPLYSSDHLKFLNRWRSYVDLFNVFNNFHLKRSLLLISRAFDIYQSGSAIEELHGIEVDPAKIAYFMNEKKMLEREISINEARYSTIQCHWFTLGESLEEKVNDLIVRFNSYKDSRENLSSQYILPPGFTVFQWRKFRFNRLYDSVKTKPVLLISGLRGPYNDSDLFKIEKEMSAVGVESFRTIAEGVETPVHLAKLSKMLFDALGIPLGEQDVRIIENSESESYLEDIQIMIKRFTTCKFNDVSTVPDYLKLWRKLMCELSEAWIFKSICQSENYFEFELHLFKYELATSNLSIEDFIDELRLEIPQRTSVSTKTLFLEHIFYKEDSISRSNSLRTFSLIKSELLSLLSELKKYDTALKFLWCSSESKQLTDFLTISCQLNQEVVEKLNTLKDLLDMNFAIYEQLYNCINMS